MSETTIDRIASDLGIFRFEDESLSLYRCRILYSAMASWIKAIAMDQPVGSREEGFYGVSRRHIYERSRVILDTFCRMYPDIEEWFGTLEMDEHPVILLRSRLINHGDLLNEGFNTNVAISSVHSNQLTPMVETVYGKIMGKNLYYSGVSVLQNHEGVPGLSEPEDTRQWLNGFLKEAWWSKTIPDMSAWQFFNPSSPVKNNYSAWQDSVPATVGGIIFARAMVNKYGYEYYLMKIKGKIVHKLDPFLQNMGCHRRIMHALRIMAGNPVVGSVRLFSDHTELCLNSRLPLKETNLLESYAWPVRHIGDMMHWTLPCPVWAHIKPYMEALGIQIVEG